MKRSEFVKQAADTYGLSGTGIAETVANIVTNQLGVKWDPEEPKLPKRLKVISDGTEIRLVPTNECYSPKMFARVYYPVAADAYNRFQSGELVPQDKLLQPALDAVVRERDHLNRLLKCERDLVARLEERLKGVDALQERDVALAELRETRLLLRDIAAAVGLSWRPHETWAECYQLALDIRTAIVAHQRPADVISKTRGGKTVHYAIGPTRETREEAEHDLREWFDKEAS